MKPLRALIKDLFDSSDVPNLTEHSTLHELAIVYPEVYGFIERKYGLKTEPELRTLSLKGFCEKYHLPPAPVLFMEIQLDARDVKIVAIEPKELFNQMSSANSIHLLDVREEWELKFEGIQGAIPLTASLLDQILTKWNRQAKIVLYCHHGIRSADAAVFLVDRGFEDVSILKGGIDAWSAQVEPSTPRYEGAYC